MLLGGGYRSLELRLDGATPLALAAEAGDTAVMRVLLDAGADPKAEPPSRGPHR